MSNDNKFFLKNSMMTFELSGQTLQNPNAAMKFRALVFKIFGLKPCVVRSGPMELGRSKTRKKGKSSGRYSTRVSWPILKSTPLARSSPTGGHVETRCSFADDDFVSGVIAEENATFVDSILPLRYRVFVFCFLYVYS